MRTPILAVALAAALACSGGSDDSTGGGTVYQPELEPNGTLATATPVTSGTVSGTATDAFDIDYFRFDVAAGPPVALRLETRDPANPACMGAVDTYLTLRNSVGSPLVANDDATGWCSLVQWVVPSGTYYAEVESGLGAFNYLLDVATLPMAHETEPNDDGAVAVGYSDFSAANANGPFTGDTTVLGSINPAGDEDVYAVTNPAGVPVNVLFRTYMGWTGLCSGSGDTVLYVHNAAGTVLASNDDYLGLCSYVTRTLAAGETVYVRVTDFGDNGVIPAYMLSIDFL